MVLKNLNWQPVTRLAFPIHRPIPYEPTPHPRPRWTSQLTGTHVRIVQSKVTAKVQTTPMPESQPHPPDRKPEQRLCVPGHRAGRQILGLPQEGYQLHRVQNAFGADGKPCLDQSAHSHRTGIPEGSLLCVNQ